MSEKTGAKIKAARERKGITQAQLANAIQRSRTAVIDIEAGRYEPTLDTLRKIAQALGADPRELI